ncbi:MAG: M23 family metallopeptidase [Reyranellaceae bacterium]
MPNSIARRAPASSLGKLLSAPVLSIALLLAVPATAQQYASAPSGAPLIGPPAQLTVPFVDGDRLAERLQRQGVVAVEAAAIEKSLRKSLSSRQRRDGVLLQLSFAGHYGARSIERVAAEPATGKPIVLSRAALGLAEKPAAPATEEAATAAAMPAAPVATPAAAEAPPAAPVVGPSGHHVVEPSPTTFAPVNMLPTRATRPSKVAMTPGFARAIGTNGADVAQSLKQAGVPRSVADEIAAAVKLHPSLGKAKLDGSRFEIAYDPSADAEAGFSLAAFTVGGREHRLWRFAPAGAPGGYFTDDGERIAGIVLRTPMPGIEINSPFGMRRHPVLRVAKFHWGVDFPAPTGTPIYAAADGVVVAAKRNGNYGLFMQIDHGNDVSTTYGHMSRFAAGMKPGTPVKAGDVIAHVGRTGLATGPHLYFEVFIGDRRVDPEPLLAEGARRLTGTDLAAFERIKQQTGVTEIASDSIN